MRATNWRLLFLSGLILVLVSFLSFESQAAKQKSKPTVKDKAKIASTKSKSKTKSKKITEPVVGEQIKVIKRQPASLDIPPGVPTELPEKVLFIPTGDSASN